MELSFLLGLATLSAATALDLAQHGSTLVADYGWATPLLGGLVAFATALIAVRWLVSADDLRVVPARCGRRDDGAPARRRDLNRSPAEGRRGING